MATFTICTYNETIVRDQKVGLSKIIRKIEKMFIASAINCSFQHFSVFIAQ